MTILTVTLTGSAGSFTLSVPTGITASEFVRSMNIGGGVWNATVFYPMLQVASISVTTS
jgi:hypothetical protein